MCGGSSWGIRSSWKSRKKNSKQKTERKSDVRVQEERRRREDDESMVEDDTASPMAIARNLRDQLRGEPPECWDNRTGQIAEKKVPGERASDNAMARQDQKRKALIVSCSYRRDPVASEGAIVKKGGHRELQNHQYY